MTLRANFDYAKVVHQSRIIGEWIDVIGYKMGFSLAGVHTTINTSPTHRTLSMDGRKTWLPISQHFLLGEFYGDHVSWPTSNPHKKKLGF
jgi:hypothetical protein